MKHIFRDIDSEHHLDIYLVLWLVYCICRMLHTIVNWLMLITVDCRMLIKLTSVSLAAVF